MRYDSRIGPWEQSKTRGKLIGKGKGYEHIEHEDEWLLTHRFAGSNDIQSGTRVRISEKIAGDPEPSAFGARRWPYINVEVNLPIAVGDDAELAERLAAHLRHVIWAFVVQNGLRRGAP